MNEINERNAGYEIIAAETYTESRLGQQDRVVLGRNKTSLGTMYVTWESTIWPLPNDNTKIDYYWGHYFDDERKARADYHARLAEKYAR